MNLSLLNQLSEWNPQLSREIKGRFTPRNVILSVAVSGMIQVLILMYFYIDLARNMAWKYTKSAGINHREIDWQWWWHDIFHYLTWIVTLALVVGGVYTLVSDLTREKSSGTLNFIRLSPQSSQSILIGKLLGVPSLVYLGISLTVPLYGVAAIQSGRSLLWILNYGLFVGISCFLLYGLALLYALIIGNHAWFVSFLSLLAYLLLGSLRTLLKSFGISGWRWFHLTLDNEFIAFQAFILVTLSISSYWIWQVLNRRFCNPNATLLSKQQSYYLVAMTQVWLLGFWVSTPKNLYKYLGAMIIVNFLVFVILAMTFSPHFQSGKDWARYRYSPNGNNRVKSSLMRANKSPTLLAIALNSLLNQLSEWNPQLSREIKGRFTPRNVRFTVAVSGISQFLILMYFYIVSPTGKLSEYESCTPIINCSIIDWPWWWEGIFQSLIWIVALALVIGGVYTLVNDLAKEKNRGTLTFIRLSPQSSPSIFIGKLLGVPSLIYLGISLTMPLGGVAAIQSGTSLLWILRYGLFVGISCFLLYSIALLYTLTIGNSAWCISSLSACLFLGMIQMYLRGASWRLFHLTIDNKFLTFQLFILAILSISSYWIWQVLNHRFCNPSATLLSKQQSYYLVAMVQVCLLGFWVDTPKNYLYEFLRIMVTLNWLAFTLLSMALSPHFQACRDWARYRHSPNGNNRSQSSLMRDLMWDSKSPALLAIALNLAITGIIWITWIFSWPSDSDKMLAIVSLIFCGNLILIYAAIAQLMLLMKTPKRVLRTVGTLIATLAVPPVVLSLLSSQWTIAPVFWLISVYSAPWLILSEASAMGILLAIISQWSILGFLSAMLTRTLQKAGESDSKPSVSTHTQFLL